MISIAVITYWIQIVSTGTLIAFSCLAVAIMKRRPDMGLLLMPPAIWAALGVIYYGLLFSGKLTPEAVVMWGAVHRLLIGVMLLGLGIILLVLLGYESPQIDEPGEDDGAY